MGGRGGSGPRNDRASDAAQFERWARGDEPINVDYVGGDRVRVMLPDADAHMVRVGNMYTILRDSDDKVLFSNHYPKGLWNELSGYYGGRVTVSVEHDEFKFLGQRAPRAATGTFGAESGRLSSPAARLYKVAD